MRLESTPAIVLRTREYGESDKIVTVLSRAAGKFSGIAKGGKRSQRRFPGTLEIFSHVTLDYKRRPHSERAFLDRASVGPGALAAVVGRGGLLPPLSAAASSMNTCG